WLVGADIHIGELGVMIFFLISGFVIPFSLRRGGPGAFAVRRFFRLYPTLWFCLLISVIVGVPYFHHFGQAFPYDTADVATSATLLSGYTGNTFVSWGLWTLAIEECFYVIAAVLAWRGKLDSPRAVLVTGAVLIAVASVLGQ